LFEGDFNNNNKWLGRAVMFHTEEHHLMAPEQYGSRKEKSAVVQCLNKCLLYDYARCHHVPMALCSNDAKSCYDRIVLIVAALCLCHLGADKASVQSMIGTIHGMHHHVWSTFGDSKIAQGHHEWGKPITGIGQGNGTGPQIWAAVSTPLFQILAEEGFLATIICATLLHTHLIIGFGFVDDTNLCITAPDRKPQTVLHNMQQSLQLWANLLRVTGGALVPEKCFWYFIQPEWNPRTAQWTYANPDPNHRLQVPDDEGNLMPIPQLKASDARRTLGVRLASVLLLFNKHQCGSSVYV